MVRKLFNYAALGVPLSLVWMLMVGDFTPISFAIGWVIGMGVLALVDAPLISLVTLPRRLAALLVYLLLLFRDIFLSGLDVARRVLDPAMPLNPGIVLVDIGDPDGREMVAAASAHGVTITPGELVVGFEDSNRMMVVHCLDQAASAEVVDAQQARRMRFFGVILGREEGTELG